jgi:hypothetical protein
MEGVAQLLDNDGVLPESLASEKDLETSFFKRVTSTVGAKIVFASFVVFIFASILAAADDVPEVLIFPFLLFLIGLAQIAYVSIFKKKTSELNKPETAKNLNSAQTQRNLPPIQSVPVSAYEPPRRNDDEMVSPPSVTETTTKLLNLEGETKDL